ncbi:hypothetical protein KY359_02880 [Candidatus Woesearchaeota archaeon]|nr:hypothetical protein [Candidatus Woesearchaeota archaeon]
MNKNFIDWLIITSKLLMWGLSILATYWIILKLTNHSPTEFQIIILFLSFISGGMIALTGFVFKIWGEVKSIRSDLRNHARECDRRFYALAKDFKNADSAFRKHMINHHKAKYA